MHSKAALVALLFAVLLYIGAASQGWGYQYMDYLRFQNDTMRYCETHKIVRNRHGQQRIVWRLRYTRCIDLTTTEMLREYGDRANERK